MVSRDDLWKIMAKYGYPEKCITIFRQLHDGKHAKKKDNGESSVTFSVSTGVKQGCILGPNLFSIMFSAILFDVFSGKDNGIDIRYRTEANFKQRPRWRLMSSTSSCSTRAVHWTLQQKPTCKTMLTTSQRPVTILSKPSAQKRQVMHQPPPGKSYVEPNITIKGQRLKVVEKFTFLGSSLTKSIILDDDVNIRLTKASAANGWFNRNMWNQRGTSEATKNKVYRAVVLTTLLYVSEMWTTYQRHMKKLNHFHTTSLRMILGITWQKHIPDIDVLTLASLPSIYIILIQLKHLWADHVVRMKDTTTLPSPEETALQRTVSRQALPRNPKKKKTLLRHTKSLHEIFPCGP